MEVHRSIACLSTAGGWSGVVFMNGGEVDFAVIFRILSESFKVQNTPHGRSWIIAKSLMRSCDRLNEWPKV